MSEAQAFRPAACCARAAPPLDSFALAEAAIATCLLTMLPYMCVDPEFGLTRIAMSISAATSSLGRSISMPAIMWPAPRCLAPSLYRAAAVPHSVDG